jgi:high affinity sulfate transporter 1
MPQMLPGLALIRDYPRGALRHDLAAGLVLSAVLVPVGMGYAQACGLPAIHGLYASVLPLVAYALFGPSRVLVLGPDSTLAAVIGAIVLPLAAGSGERALALAAALAMMSGALLLMIGLLRLGRVADLFSKPIRIGFLNAIALTVVVGQLPTLLGFAVDRRSLAGRLLATVHGVLEGRTAGLALAVGTGSLLLIVALRRWRPRWPGVLLAVAGATAMSAWGDWGLRQGLAVVGAVPSGLPLPALPAVGGADLEALLPGALVIALLVFADTSVLSRALAARAGVRVDPSREMLALGAANLAAGCWQGFPVSASASRTPVAEAAGARTQLAGVVGAAAIVVLLVAAPGLLADLPRAALAAVVIAASFSFADLPAMATLWRQRRSEFVLALVAFVGVAFIGVIEGVVVAMGLSVLLLFWNAWHPYHAVLVRVDGRRGWHDRQRHPDGRPVPGMLLFRWDAELFFANAEVFQERLRQALDAEPAKPRWIVVAADAITDIDVTAADMLAGLDRELESEGTQLRFAGLKGPVKDWLVRYGFGHQFDPSHFDATVSAAVDACRARQASGTQDRGED